MSFTITYNPERSSTTTSAIHLSPSKRRRSTPPPDIPQRTKHSAKEIWSWTFMSAAIVPCYVRDIMEMEENTIDHYDFFWLGYVPCRSAKIVGMVVGLHIYEKKILYSIDDGTGVVDCSHTQDMSKTKNEESNSKYRPPENIESQPSPIAEIGQLVEVKGKIRSFFGSDSRPRQIVVNSIALCSSSNDELFHARAIRKLHETVYSRTDTFEIPPPTQEPHFVSPPKRKSTNAPSRMLPSPQSSVSSSPIKAHSNSPVKPTTSKRPSIKLRHPSRLHTHDLTANTFRIYIKHYMDCIQEPQRSGYDSDAIIAESISRIPSTPTKRYRSDETPRQSSRYDFNTTPRPRIPALNFDTKGADTTPFDSAPPSQTPTTTRRGFSLSYLRRVPELALLGSRVAEAVARRQLRAERKIMKEARSSQKARYPLSSTTNKTGPRMKRLFQWAIIQLLKEGCIALWDGPVRLCPDTSIANVSRLWKLNTSTSTVGGDSTIFGTTSGSIPSFWGDDQDEGEALSDPDPDEEAYISLTPEYFADFVEDAIKVLVDHYQTIGKPYSGATRDGILSVLRKDDRWQYVGTWTIDEALEYLKTEERVWDMGKGRWDLTE